MLGLGLSLGLAPIHGVPASIIVDGVTYYLLRDDDTGDILRDDTNRPLYDEAA